MIRPFTCVCLLLAAGSGLYLYQTKHQTQVVDRDLERTLKLADAAWQRSGVLRAEYTLLNDPSRLADLSGQYLPTLQTTAPGQFSTWTDLDRRLPAVGPPPSDPAPPSSSTLTASLQPDAAAPEAPRPEPVRPEPVRAEQPRPEPPRIEPARVDPPKPAIAALPSRPVAPVASVAPVAPVASVEPAQPRPVAMAPPRVQTPTPAPTVARSVLLPVPIAPAITNVAVLRRVPAPPVNAAEAVTQVARNVPAEPSAPMVGSALGMARSITPSQAHAYAGPAGNSLR